MNERLQKIADDLGTNVYKDSMHGQIAKENFIYGVKQAELEGEAFYIAEMLRKEKEETDHLREVKQMVVDKACEWLCEHIDDYARIGEDGAWVEHSVVRDFRKAMGDTK